jgi:hypothetical protein
MPLTEVAVHKTAQAFMASMLAEEEQPDHKRQGFSPGMLARRSQ